MNLYLYELLLNTLKKEKSFLNNNNDLLKHKVIDSTISKDKDIYSKLLHLLLNNSRLKEEFFHEVDDITIFERDNFCSYLKNNEFLDGSYTQFDQSIGFNIRKELNNNVVLDFPYKDCILEGGQTKEEQKKDEVFFNEILAKDEITKLLMPKVLTNSKKYNSDGEHKFTEFNRDKEINKKRGLSEDTITDNLLIKGNNLLALKTLEEEFRGKVKLIYIDPPYNTGNDGFKYNDNFNHSTWLTFMKNRLEVARKLLRDDGIIFIQCDYNESHYIKILMDEIFKRDCFINDIVWKRKFGNANETKRLGTAYDNILIFAKTGDYQINLIKEKDSKHVKEYIKKRFTRKDIDGRHKGKLWMPYPLANPGEATKNLIYDYKGYSSPKKGWRMVKEKLKKLDNEDRLYFPQDKTQRIQEKKFLDEYQGQPIDSLWTDIFVINSQSKEAFNFDGQKPEDLIKRIIEISTKEDDIVLDYHLGSGTTVAVAHKMNRQYIGIEQMDYIEDITIERMKKVVGKKVKKESYLLKNIEYDQGGISKSVNWRGGGSFVYFELKQYNEKFVEDIKHASSKEKLVQVFNDICEKGFSKYNIDMKALKEDLKKGDKSDLLSQSISEIQEKLYDILDKNMLYVPLELMNDERYKVSEEDKELTKSFYNKE